jgi:hypothetical protein
MTDLETDLLGRRVLLLPEKALFCPENGTLYIADLHLGKDSTFAAHAIPLPQGTTGSDLSRLQSALTRMNARRLVILGDLLHARRGINEALIASVADWRDRHRNVEMLLVRGNHDRGAVPMAWDIRVREAPVRDDPFRLVHDPADSDFRGAFLAGHLHPAVTITGKGRQQITLPCFWFRAQMAVLPAFGGFTGYRSIDRAEGGTFFAVTPERVFEVKA